MEFSENVENYSYKDLYLISIIIPTYNDQCNICRAIDSCLAQTYKNIEIIVIDDGSIDMTKQYLDKYKNIKNFIYTYQTNSGRSSARNRGLDIANGKYIQFLDSDDLLYPDKLKQQIEFLISNQEYFMVYCKVAYKNCFNQIIKVTDVTKKQDFKKLFSGNFLAINAPLISTNRIRFRENLDSLEDWEYWLHAIFQKKIGYIDKILCEVSITERQMSVNYLYKMIKGEIFIYKKLILDLKFKKYSLLIFFELIKRCRVLFWIKLKSFVLKNNHES